MDEINQNDYNILKTNCHKTIDEICEKYKNNEYILGRINTHINTVLSTTIESELKSYEERIERHNNLTIEQNNFIQIFLNKNNYYYLPSCGLFYEYDGTHYMIAKEDDIIHNLLCAISKERVLLNWKHKTKINIMKQIKERNLFKSIPELDTIQNILNLLCPLIFSTKDEAKYFLTIYGANILKKTNNLVFLVHPHTKKILTEIDKYANYFIGISNLSGNFMTKYHETHDYNICRLLNSVSSCNIGFFLEQLKIFGLDLFCVAAHYSNRYELSDNYIDNKSYNNLRTYTYYLRDNKQDYIVNNFCNKYIEKCDPENGCFIQWKNLHYVWKQFLSSMGLPNIIYSNNLKNILKTKYEYNEETDAFLNVTTKFLPLVGEFIKFWETTMTTENTNTNKYNPSLEYELDEICGLFKFWKGSSGNMNEQEVIKIMKHFFPTIEIIEDKYIIGVKSILFDKTMDIRGSLEILKKDNAEFLPKSIISFEDLYTYYNNYYKSIENNANVPRFIVSKRYFENYISEELQKYVVYNNFITCEWFQEKSE